MNRAIHQDADELRGIQIPTCDCGGADDSQERSLNCVLLRSHRIRYPFPHDDHARVPMRQLLVWQSPTQRS